MNNQISGDAFPQKILKVLQGSAAYCTAAAPGKLGDAKVENPPWEGGTLMSSQNETTGRLTTHVLDTASGKPAANLRVDLLRLDGEQFSALRSTRTNADGRCDAPLLAGAEMRAGTYELRFHVGAYLGGQSDGAVPFLDVVPIRFGIGDEAAHYHVPLLVAPYAYSTYRGS